MRLSSIIDKLPFYLRDLLKAWLIKQLPLTYSFFRVKPFFAAINITDRCCFRCIMCNQWENRDKNELTLDEWREIFQQFKENGIKEVAISGGEPFLREDIMEIIAYLKMLGFKVSIITNGYLLNKFIIDKLIDLKVSSISISLDALGTDFDKIRGINGAYEKVFDSCKMLLAYKEKISVFLYFTLMRHTVDFLPPVLEISEQLKFPLVVNLFDYTPYFFSQVDKDNFWIKEKGDFDKLKALQKIIVEKKNKNHKITYHLYSEIEYFKNYFKDPLQKNIPCSVSQQRICIDSEGNVYGGCWSIGRFGNLKNKSLKEIVNSKDYKLVHKKMFFKNCRGCSCGYATNIRYYLPYLIREMGFFILPFRKSSIWR